MRLKNTHINITLDHKTKPLPEEKLLSYINEEVILESLTKKEDKALSRLAEKRELENNVLISHKDAWK